MSNWMWLESTSAHNHPKYNKFFSETILKISAALSELTASFEGILIFQITNLKDEKVKDSIQKQIKNIKNSLTDDEFIDSIKNILKFIWRMDLISLLIIAINAEIFNTNRAVKEKAVKTSLTEKQNSLQIRSFIWKYRQSSERELSMERNKPRSQPTQKEVNEANRIEKQLILKMEALDLEEEKFFEENEHSNSQLWCKEYQLKFKQHLKLLLQSK